MGSANPVFREGGSNNKGPCFVGEYYGFWKIRMRAYLEIQGDDIWDGVEIGRLIPTTIINNEEQVKVKGSWNEDDKKKVIFEKRKITCFNLHLG